MSQIRSNYIKLIILFHHVNFVTLLSLNIMGDKNTGLIKEIGRVGLIDHKVK